MARRIRGELSARGRRFAIVAGEFNRPLTERLVDGAIDCLSRHGAADGDIDVVYVPGSFELPQMVARIADRGYAAILALSVLIRGETPHFDLIARAVTSELSRLGATQRVPIAFGVVTADTIEQAEVRCGVKAPGKGWDAAVAAITMADVSSRLEE